MPKVNYNLQRKLHETRAEQIRIEMEIEDLREQGYSFEKTVYETPYEGTFHIFTVLQDGYILFEWSDEFGLEYENILPKLPPIVQEVFDKMTHAHKKWLGGESDMPRDHRYDEFGIEWTKV